MSTVTAPSSAVQSAASATGGGKRVWIDGKLVPAAEAMVSVFDHGLLYGDGVFEGIRVYNGRIFKLASHLRRLYDSAKAIRLTMPMTLDALAQATRDTVAANATRDGYIRLCVTRGVGTLGLNPFTCKHPIVFIIADAITLYPREYYDNGLAVVTASTIRNHSAAVSPRIKSMNYLNNILAKIEAIDAGCMEAVMLNSQGFVAECTGDNIFIVRRFMSDGDQPVLITPPLHAGVLEGITMNTVIGLAHDAGIKVLHTDITKHDLYTADEMFLTGTAAEIIPVTSIDKRTIGPAELAGKPGPVTQQLTDAFHALVAKNAPED
jgi:branched-chain amino acid aminotransferase